MDCTGKQGALGNGGLRAAQIGGSFTDSQTRVCFPQKSKKLLCALVNTQRGKVSFFRCALNEVNDPVGQGDLRRDIPAIVQNIIKALLNYISQILRQHLGCLRLVDRCNSLAGFRNLRKLAAQRIIDDLFIKAMV